MNWLLRKLRTHPMTVISWLFGSAASSSFTLTRVLNMILPIWSANINQAGDVVCRKFLEVVFSLLLILLANLILWERLYMGTSIKILWLRLKRRCIKHGMKLFDKQIRP